MTELNLHRDPCILLVTRSITFLTLAKQYLKRTSAKIIEANNCEAALEACRQHSPQLIYLAANLPDPGGIECCLRIKSDPEFCQIPLVLMATDADGDPSTLSRRSNCDAVIGMPPLQQNFLAIGRSFLAGFREHRYGCQLPAKLQLQDRQENCLSIDISSNGAFFAFQAPLTLGHPVQVELQLTLSGDTGPRIKCHGQVAWINTEEQPIKPNHPAGFGIKFTDVSPRDAAVLNGFLKSLPAEISDSATSTSPALS